MILTLQRETESDEWTQGKLFIDGEFECFTLEDQSQDKKVMHETRIPAGTFKVLLRTVGSHHSRYSKKFPVMHKGMLHLQQVPGFQYILIHIGNTDDDSSGCILVGKFFKSGKLISSTLAYLSLYKKVVDAAAEDNLWITIKEIERC